MRRLALALCIAVAADALADVSGSVDVGPIYYQVAPLRYNGSRPVLEFIHYWALASPPMIMQWYDDGEIHGGVAAAAEGWEDTLAASTPAEWPLRASVSMTGLQTVGNRNIALDAALAGAGADITALGVYGDAGIEFGVPAYTWVEFRIPTSMFGLATPTAGSTETFRINATATLYIDGDSYGNGTFLDSSTITVATDGALSASADSYLTLSYYNYFPFAQYGGLTTIARVTGSSITSPVITAPVPEPGQWVMLATGCMLMGVIAVRRRRQAWQAASRPLCRARCSARFATS